MYRSKQRDRQVYEKKKNKNARKSPSRKIIRRSGFSLKGIVESIRTSSELEREVDGLVTHLAKHLSFVFCVKSLGGEGQKRHIILARLW